MWCWLILRHWLRGSSGEYYEAWVLNAYDKRHDPVREREAANSQSENDATSDLAGVEEYFGVPISRPAMNKDFALAYTSDEDHPRGVYLCQRRSRVRRGPQPDPNTWESEWANVQVSERYSLLRLQFQFPDVFWRVLRNGVDVFAVRVLPWILVAVTLVLLAIGILLPEERQGQMQVSLVEPPNARRSGGSDPL